MLLETATMLQMDESTSRASLSAQLHPEQFDGCAISTPLTA